MATVNNLNELLIEELQDLLSAENQLTKALPKMAAAATDEDLKAGFEQHLEETQDQIERLERVFAILGEEPKQKKCKAMEGLIAEAQEKIELQGDSAVRDAALIGAAQKVEHYEIAGYGTVRTFAEVLGNEEVVELLQATLDEEVETDEKLTELSESLNQTAEEQD